MSVSSWSGLIPGLKDHFLDSIQCLNSGNISIRHVGGNQIGNQGQIPLDVQRLTIQNISGNPSFHYCLAFFPDFAVGRGDCIGSDSVDAGNLVEALVHPPV